MEHLSEEFWTNRYAEDATGWDLGTISPPIKAYIDQLENKELKILIPGCGNGHEAEYLWQQGFSNVHLLDLSKAPLDDFQNRLPDFPSNQIHVGDFFTHEGTYDLIFEQTMFCAIDPSLRAKYASTSAHLLRNGGKLVGVMFNTDFDGGPPYGGSKKEYEEYFQPFYTSVEMNECYNSIQPRLGRELFVQFVK
ncbi:MAG: methyltransferase domain-containing protein [Crocinitomicaceae bacterium]|nr:methyltransferase domain-containing protein [Crocinitomicaceae bacterium]